MKHDKDKGSAGAPAPQATYLYGHPQGHRKRFRSPADFFPHLLWLGTDESGNSRNCACKLCCPEELESDKAVAKAMRAAAFASTGDLRPTATTQPATRPAVRIPAQSPIAASTQSKQSPATKPPTPAPQNPPRTSAPPATAPTPLPQPRTLDQQIDSQYNKFLCRIGEIVWFFRGSAWGLGVVLRRWLDNPSLGRGYQIRPLTYPGGRTSLTTISVDTELRPWLAWSAPPFTYSYLNTNPDTGYPFPNNNHNVHTYERVDWHGLLSQKYGTDGDAEVDASILAAKSIDRTYTLVDVLKTVRTGNHAERYWNGLWLGAERIWNGDPIRVRTSKGSKVMVVTAIVQRVTPPTPGSTTAPASDVFVVGDVYSYTNIHVPNPTAPPNIPSNSALPVRMREDLDWMNSITARIKLVGFWKLLMPQSTFELFHVQGRWYENSVLFRTEFETSVTQGKPGEGTWMNSRGDASSLIKAAGVRTSERLEALGPAVPGDTKLLDGFDPPPPPPQRQPAQQQMNLQSTQVQAPLPSQSLTDPSLDDYLNLDEMEIDPMQNFNSLGSGFTGWGT